MLLCARRVTHDLLLRPRHTSLAGSCYRQLQHTNADRENDQTWGPLQGIKVGLVVLSGLAKAPNAFLNPHLGFDAGFGPWPSCSRKLLRGCLSVFRSRCDQGGTPWYR